VAQGAAANVGIANASETAGNNNNIIAGRNNFMRRESVLQAHL
jgi:hypothetical protein